MIEAQSLTKIWRPPGANPFRRPEPVTALEGVTFRVEPGRMMTVVGPNGAGKTTLLKILIGLALPTSGAALVAGASPAAEPRKVRAAVGFAGGDERSFYWRLTGRQNLEYFAALYDVKGAEIRSRAAEGLAWVGLEKAADRPFSGYSSGMRQRLALARALIHDPPVLLLDEPSRGLDPADKAFFRRFVLKELLEKRGKTALIATHEVEEILEFGADTLLLAEGRATVTRFSDAESIRRAVARDGEGRGFRA